MTPPSPLREFEHQDEFEVMYENNLKCETMAQEKIFDEKNNSSKSRETIPSV